MNFARSALLKYGACAGGFPTHFGEELELQKIKIFSNATRTLSETRSKMLKTVYMRYLAAVKQKVA